MKYIFLVSAFLFFTAARAQQPGPQQVVEQLFRAMQAGDTAALRAVFDSTARLQTCILNGVRKQYELHTESLDGFLQQVARVKTDSLQIEERILKWEVRVDEPLATVWTPYRFYLNGKFSHYGTNAFQLFHSPFGWKIIQVTDTRKRNSILKK